MQYTGTLIWRRQQMNYSKQLSRFLKAKQEFEAEKKKFDKLRQKVSADVKKYVGNKKAFAEEIGMSRNTLYLRMKYHDWDEYEIQKIQKFFHPNEDPKQLSIE